MEDLLTSMVFGTLRHLDIEYLRRFLQGVFAPDGRRPLQGLPTFDCATYTFWPNLHAAGCRSCEPDIQIDVVHENGERLVILVEAKYWSGKSSFAEDSPEGVTDRPANDQLAKQWENLTSLHGASAWVVYVTPDIVMPRDDIEQAQKELEAKAAPRGNIAWASFRSLVGVLSSRGSLAKGSLAHNLLLALRRLDLVPFEGIEVECRKASWSFSETSMFDWHVLRWRQSNWAFAED